MADEIDFGTESYRHDSLPVSAQRLVNAYVEAQPHGAKSRKILRGCPGIADFATLGHGPIRAGLVMNTTAYFVSGDNLYSVDSSGVGTLLGAGIPGEDVVSMDGTGAEVVITQGDTAYSYVLATNDFSQITDSDFNPASTVTVINNIFAFDEVDSNRFQISDILDGRTYLGDFASAESNPDYVIAVKNRNGVLVVFGQTTTEFWDHTGASDFPFTRYKGGTIDRGLRGPYAFTAEDESLFLLSNDLVFYQLVGQQKRRISTHALEQTWQKYGTTADAYCFSVPIEGHKFIYLVFPSENATFGFDIATQRWHERVSYDSGGNEVKWRASCCVSAYDKVLVGDANSGKIGILDPNVYTEFGDPIITSVTMPPIYQGGKLITIPTLEIDMETGVGLLSGQGSDPEVMLNISKDGGRTFPGPELIRALGGRGEHLTRLRWDRLGSARQWVFKVSVSDPVKRVITGARCPDIEIEV